MLLFAVLSSAAFAAEPAACWSASEGGNIRLMEGGECRVEHTSVEGRDCVLVRDWGGPANYMYFAIDPETRSKIEPSGSLVIEYCLTKGAFVQLNSEINSSKGAYDSSGTVMYLGGGWNRAVVNYGDFVPAGTMNFGADFRLTSREGLAVSRVEIYNETIDPGSGEDALDDYFKTMSFNDKRKGDAFYVFGVGVYSTIDANTGRLLRKLGVTSVENYVTWRSVENEGEGKWDWSLWDKNLEVIRESGLKWSPAIMHSPAYTIPDWYAESDEFVPNACLEHGIAGKTISLWSPGFDRWTERFVAAFAERYRDTGMIESLIPGIQGDFGEAIYTVEGNSVIYNLIGGPYHNHIGYWCNDPWALKSFRDFARDKYGDIKDLNAAWHTSFGSFEDVRYPFYGEEEINSLMERMPRDPSCRRHYLDFVRWYRNCMTEHADRWLAMLRKYFPDTPIYLCTGGHTDPRLGASFAEECRVAAKTRRESVSPTRTPTTPITSSIRGRCPPPANTTAPITATSRREPRMRRV